VVQGTTGTALPARYTTSTRRRRPQPCTRTRRALQHGRASAAGTHLVEVEERVFDLELPSGPPDAKDRSESPLDEQQRALTLACVSACPWRRSGCPSPSAGQGASPFVCRKTAKTGEARRGCVRDGSSGTLHEVPSRSCEAGFARGRRAAALIPPEPFTTITSKSGRRGHPTKPGLDTGHGLLKGAENLLHARKHFVMADDSCFLSISVKPFK
jgi:hypothetical protein